MRREGGGGKGKGEGEGGRGKGGAGKREREEEKKRKQGEGKKRLVKARGRTYNLRKPSGIRSGVGVRIKVGLRDTQLDGLHNIIACHREPLM
jgi:hypothetical protein